MHELRNDVCPHCGGRATVEVNHIGGYGTRASVRTAFVRATCHANDCTITAKDMNA